MKNITLVICAIGISLFLSCEKDITFKYEKNAIDSSKFDICKTQDCPEIDVSYINFKEPNTMQTIVQKWTLENIITSLNLDQQTSSDINDVLLTYINNSQISYPETTVFSDTHEFSAEVVVLYTSNEVVCLGFYSDVFDGGAHGYYEEIYGLFNPKSGQMIAPSSLVKDSFFAFAKARLSQAYSKVSFSIIPSSLSEEILQLGFTDDGVLLVYQDTDVFPISDEPYKLIIPWSEAEDHLTF